MANQSWSGEHAHKPMQSAREAASRGGVWRFNGNSPPASKNRRRCIDVTAGKKLAKWSVICKSKSSGKPHAVVRLLKGLKHLQMKPVKSEAHFLQIGFDRRVVSCPCDGLINACSLRVQYASSAHLPVWPFVSFAQPAPNFFLGQSTQVHAR